MQNEFFDFVVFGIEEQILEVNILNAGILYKAPHNTYHPKREIVVKIVRLQLGRFSVRIWRMNFHFILRLVKYSVRRSHRGHHILHRVAELNCLLKQSGEIIISHHAAGQWLTFKYSDVFPRAGKLDLPTSPRLGSRTRVRPRVESPALTTSTARHVRLG